MAKQHAWILGFGELGLKSRTVRRAFQRRFVRTSCNLLWTLRFLCYEGENAIKTWDSYIDRRSRMRDEEGTSHERPAWGVSGLDLSDAAPYVQQRESAIKSTPLCTLEPLLG